MAADHELKLWSDERARADRVARVAIADVLRIEAKFSRYRDDSVVHAIHAAGGAPVEVDDETAQLLDYAALCWEASRGRFDVTSGVLRRVWRFNDGAAGIPADEALAAVLPLIGWQRVVVGEGTVRLPLRGMELDFGGFGKEYAVDRAALRLRDCGVESGMVNLAGDLAILGPQPGGAPWRVGIRHPRNPDAIIASLPIYSGAIATSGDYERFIEADGVRHCHVLDPRTGRSARGFQSVTVHASSCVVAGTASTIAMLKGAAEGRAWLESLGLPYLCVLEDGGIVNAMGEKVGAI